MREVVAGKTARAVVERKGDDEDHTDKGKGQADHRDENSVAETVADDTAGDESDDFDGAARGAVEKGLGGSVAEGNDLGGC